MEHTQCSTLLMKGTNGSRTTGNMFLSVDTNSLIMTIKPASHQQWTGKVLLNVTWSPTHSFFHVTRSMNLTC